MLLLRLIDIYSLIVLASVLVSWMHLSHDNPIVRILDALVEPALYPIRQILPAVGGLDFSPMILIFALQFLKSLVV